MHKSLHVFTAVLVVSIMLLQASCCISIGDQNDPVIDGIKLKYENETSLSAKYDMPNLEILGGTLSASLQGRAGNGLIITIGYNEFEPGDAVVYIEDGKIKTKSVSGKPVSIFKVTGSIPENLSLNIQTGTGTIELSELKGKQGISINCGTGDFELIDSRIESLSVKTGTGSVSLSNNQIGLASIKTGTGNIKLNHNIINQQDFSVGTGKIISDESKLDPENM